MRWGVVLVLCSGCDLLFQLQHVDKVDADLGEAGEAAIPFTCDQQNISDGDWDSDGKPNAEDECPDIAAESPDTDHDGIGDACDPRPDMPGDCIRVFTDFRTPDPRCWTTTGWTYGCFAGDQLGWCSPGGSHRTPLEYSGLAPLAFARMTGTIYKVNGMTSAVVLLQAYAQSTNLTGSACGVTVYSDGNFAGVEGAWSNDALTSGLRAPMVPSLAYQPAVIHVERSLTGFTTFCREQATATTISSIASTSAPDKIGPFAIHTVATEFRVETVTGYNFGAGCD